MFDEQAAEFIVGQTFNYPWPQVFRGKQQTVVATESTVYLLDEQGATLSSISLTKDVSTVTAGGLWQFVDLYNAFMLVDDRGVIFYNPQLGFVSSAPTSTIHRWNTGWRIGAACEHEGRFFFGNFTSNIWSSLRQNDVIYTSRGGGDVLTQLFTPPEVSQTFTTEDFYDRVLRRKDSGIVPLKSQGPVWALKPIGRAVAAYTDSGVSLLTMAGTYVGEQKIYSGGIFARGAVCASERSQVFIDEQCCLWRIGADLGMQRLGYEEHLKGSIGPAVQIFYDSQYDEYHICDQGASFVLTSEGLGESNFTYCGLFNTQGNLQGVGGLAVGTECYIETALMDFNTRGIKKITSVEVMGEFLTDLQVRVGYRYDNHSDLSYGVYVSSPIDGRAFPHVSGKELSLACKFTGEPRSKVSAIRINWQYHDKTTMRSNYYAGATPNA